MNWKRIKRQRWEKGWAFSLVLAVARTQTGCLGWHLLYRTIQHMNIAVRPKQEFEDGKQLLLRKT